MRDTKILQDLKDIKYGLLICIQNIQIINSTEYNNLYSILNKVNELIQTEALK